MEDKQREAFYRTCPQINFNHLEYLYWLWTSHNDIPFQ